MTQNNAAAPNVADNDLPYGENETDYDEFDEHDDVVKPRAAPFYKRKRFWVICMVITVILVAILVPIILFLILPKVAQTIVNNSSLAFDNIVISEPTNTVSLFGPLFYFLPLPITSFL